MFGLFNASFTESITFSHKNMTPRARARALMRQEGDGTGGDEGERGRRGWMEERADELSEKHKEGLFSPQRNWP